jgi:nucleotide sugar dehydrogenase
MSLKVAVVGLGYVGLPLAKSAVDAGHDVLGFDVSFDRIKAINEGKSHVEDVSNDDLRTMAAAGFRATSDPTMLRGLDVITICVPTPLAPNGSPDLSYVISASEMIAENITRGTTVILESTTYPGTTSEVVAPILQRSNLIQGEDFYLAFSPERIDPGNKKFGLSNTPKVVGADDPLSLELADKFYRTFVPSVFKTIGTKEAETAKLLENTYRQVNIALVNEFAKICHSLGIDVWNVISAASTKPFGFQSFFPGIGVGGHCIPIDPSYLAFKLKQEVGDDFEFITLAQRISGEMPAYVAKRVKEKYLELSNKNEVKGVRLAVFGVSYKPNSSDIRETPAADLISALSAMGFTVSFVDPNVENFEVGGVSVPKMQMNGLTNRDVDMVIVTQAHKEFVASDSSFWSSFEAPVFDATGQIKGDNIFRL